MEFRYISDSDGARDDVWAVPVGAGSRHDQQRHDRWHVTAARIQRAAAQEPTRAGDTGLETNSIRIVRTMFILYTLLIAGGIVFFVTVGLTQQ